MGGKKAELQRLVPIPWQWEVKKHGDNSFLTVFPNAGISSDG
jgi:hypothetical protein